MSKGTNDYDLHKAVQHLHQLGVSRVTGALMPK